MVSAPKAVIEATCWPHQAGFKFAVTGTLDILHSTGAPRHSRFYTDGRLAGER